MILCFFVWQPTQPPHSVETSAVSYAFKSSQVGSFRGGKIRPRRSLRDERFGGDSLRVAIHGWSLKKPWTRLVAWYFWGWFWHRFWRTAESWENPGRLLGTIGESCCNFLWSWDNAWDSKENTQKGSENSKENQAYAQRRFSYFLGIWSTQTFFSQYHSCQNHSFDAVVVTQRTDF